MAALFIFHNKYRDSITSLHCVSTQHAYDTVFVCVGVCVCDHTHLSITQKDKGHISVSFHAL